MAVFIGNIVKVEHWFSDAKSKSAFRKCIVFFRLCPGKFSYSCFSFCEAFTREARTDLTQPVEADRFEKARHECLLLYARKAVEMSDVRARDSSAFLLFEDNFKVSECIKWIIDVLMISTDLFQDRTENKMFGHPTRNAFALTSPSSRFFECPYAQLRDHSVWTYSPSSQKMGVAVEVACLNQKNIDKHCPLWTAKKH